MNYDVMPEKGFTYCRATLPPNGMIEISGLVFHQGNVLSRFRTLTFDSFEEAISTLPKNKEMFIMSFDKDGCERMWFSESQVKNGITERLDIWKACYGKYPVSSYKNREKK